MKIPNTAIPTCYKYSKQAFEGIITPDAARQKIHDELKINYGSAKDYYLYFNYLMTGIKPTWGLNKFTTNYFLEHILNDTTISNDQKKRTLLYFKILLEKFEGDKIGSKKSMRVIYEQYAKDFI